MGGVGHTHLCLNDMTEALKLETGLASAVRGGAWEGAETWNNL